MKKNLFLILLFNLIYFMYPIEQDLKIVTEYIQKEKVMEYIQFEGQKKISDNLSVFVFSTAFCYENKEKHFLNLNSYFQNYVNANVLLNKLCHKIPLIGDDNKYIFQNGDCLISPSPHIVLIDTEKNLVSRNDYDLRIVQIIHNYFGYDNDTTKITLLTNDNSYTTGYFSRTLKGPFRHAGISLSSTTVGRICLWY